MSETPETSPNSSPQSSSDHLPLCPVCGLLLTTSEARCPSCGASLAPSVGEVAPLPTEEGSASVTDVQGEMLASEARRTQPTPRWKWGLLAANVVLLVVCVALTATNMAPMLMQAPQNTPLPTTTATLPSGVTTQPVVQPTQPGETPTSTAGASKGGAQSTPTTASSTPTATPPPHPTATATPLPSPTPDPTPPMGGGG